MARTTIGPRGSIKALEDAISMLDGLSRNLRSDASFGAIEVMQRQALGKVREAVYGNRYGKSLAQIFSRTRKKGDMSPGGGTPVKTGRLQNSLTAEGAPYSIYSENYGKGGYISVTYGGDPVDKGERYFPKVEERYGFFEDGINQFERSRTLKKLHDDIAKDLSAAVRNRIAQRIRRAMR
jgi:hypothetical protein